MHVHLIFTEGEILLGILDRRGYSFFIRLKDSYLKQGRRERSFGAIRKVYSFVKTRSEVEIVVVSCMIILFQSVYAHTFKRQTVSLVSCDDEKRDDFRGTQIHTFRYPPRSPNAITLEGTS